MALTIRRAQRNLLRQQVITELTGIGDIYLAVEADQWATALKLRERHEDLMRLLDDLGWRADDPGREFALTTEPARLLRCLARLHERAGETIEQYVGADAEERAAAWDASFVMCACGDLLVKLLAAAHLGGAPGYCDDAHEGGRP